MTRIVLPGEPLVYGPTALRPWRDSDLGWVVAQWSEPGEPPVAFREQLDANSFLDRPEQVGFYTAALAESCRVAAGPEQSVALLGARLEELR